MGNYYTLIMNAGDTHQINFADVVNYVVYGSFAPIMRRDKISMFHQRVQDIIPLLVPVIASLWIKQQQGRTAPQVFNVARLPRRKTASVGTTTEDILVKMERQLIKDGITTFGLDVDDIRPVVHGLVAELFAEQAAHNAINDSKVA